MVRLIAIIISILLQFLAAIVAIRLTKVTKYRLSWILISLGFVFMAIRRVMDLLQFLDRNVSEVLLNINDWIALVIALFITIGVFLIDEIFNSLKKADMDRLKTEKRILNAVISAEENERKRFAKDLHDGLGPLLSSIKLSISALDQLESESSKKEIIGNAANAINEAITSIKEVSNNLSPHILNNFGLVTSLRSFINKLASSRTIKIDFETNLGEDRFDQNAELILYRSLCELINNTIRHAEASLIGLTLVKTGNTLLVHYQDDGKGFEAEKLFNENQAGMGYSNILTRIKSINGEFNVESSPGSGMHAEMKINLSQSVQN